MAAADLSVFLCLLIVSSKNSTADVLTLGICCGTVRGMTERASTPSNPRAIRVLILVLAGLMAIAASVAIRLVSAGTIHHSQDTMRAVSALHRAGPAVFSQDAFATEKAAVPDGFEVLGGSRTSILGASAVLLELRREQSGERHTLYAWARTPAFASVRSSSRDVDGVRVDIWTDADHIYALCRDLND